MHGTVQSFCGVQRINRAHFPHLQISANNDLFPAMSLRFARFLSTTPTLRANYGFIGLGQMGQHMARHIYAKMEPSDKLYVFDTVPEATASFVDTVTQQKPEAKSQLHTLDAIPKFVTDVDAQLDFIVSMVPEGKHVKGVVSELVDAYKKNPQTGSTTFLDSSTIDIPTSVEVHQMVKKELPEFDFIDTPVSGGVAGARKGTLSFMLSREDHKDVAPDLVKLLNMMGTNIFPCGKNHGAGLAAKLSNNYLLAVTNLAVADSFQLAKSFGLNLQHYAKLVSVSTGKSWASVDNCPIPGVYPENNLPADVGYKGGFITKLTKKDLVLATDCANQYDRALFLGPTARKWYLKACEREDLGSRDLGVLYEWLGELEEKNGEYVDKKTSESFKV
ncbi:hypothetical protein ACNR91_000093 [Candidozyma auris]|nr:hypothetical protein QG37_07443 [[Candida] auris]